MRLSSLSYAETVLSYCEKERDQAEVTLTICHDAILSCKAVNKDLGLELIKENEIIKLQTKEVAEKNKELAHKDEANTVNKIVFGVLGLVVGLILHIPLTALGVK